MNDIVWAIELDDGPILIADTDEEAIETQQIAEYELGYVAVVHRPN